jgi:hypothetical protein
LLSSEYFPDWAKHKDVSKYCSNIVCMSLETNLNFSIDRLTPSQIKALEKEIVHFESPDVDFSAVQGLLHSSKYLHLADSVCELSKYLHISREHLLSRIKLRTKGNGHLPYLDSSAFKNIKVDSRFLQVDNIGIDHRPIIDVLNLTKAGWSYKSKNGAYLALFLHCICNLNLCHQDHWSLAYLRNNL